MKRIDWDAYFDGTMDSAQRAEIDADATLVPERDGFKAFREALQASAHAERVPIGQLEAKLAQVAARTAPKAPKWVLRSAPLLLGLAAFAWWINQPTQPGFVPPSDAFALARTPVQETLQTADSEDAALWIASRKPYPVPVLTPKGEAHLVAARVGRGWSSYSFNFEGHPVVLEMSEKDRFDEAPTATQGGNTFFRGASGLGWRDQGLSFYVNGCAPGTLESNARTLFEAVKTGRRVKGKKKGNSAMRPIVTPL